MPKFLYKNFFYIFILDIILVAFSWYFSHQLRFNFSVPQNSIHVLTHFIPLVVIIKIVIFYIFDLYQGMWRYPSLSDLVGILKAVSVATLIVIIMTFFVHRLGGFSRSIFIIDWGLTLFLVAGSRVAIRFYFWIGAGDESARVRSGNFIKYLFKNKEKGKRLIIIGAGDCGEKISREIHDNPHLGYDIIGFIDDDTLKSDRRIHGIPILGNTDDLKYYADQLNAQELLIAMPSISAKDMRNVVKRCEESSVPFKTVPGMGELINGKVTVKAIRDVAYRDLLGRESVELDEAQIGAYLKDKRVLITGAGGSIGSELCRQVCRFMPESLILYERAESPLYEIELELKEHFQYLKIIPKLADILDVIKLENIVKNDLSLKRYNKIVRLSGNHIVIC